MSIQYLPRELVDRIIGNLVDKRDLSSASLVSSYFLPSARPRLFSDIRVFTDPLDRYHILRDFISFIKSAPHIARLIYHLTIQQRLLAYAPPDSKPYKNLAIELLDYALSTLLALQTLHLSDIQLYRSLPPDAPLPGRYHLQNLTISNYVEELEFILCLHLFSYVEHFSIRDHRPGCQLLLWEQSERSFRAFTETHHTAVPLHFAVSKVHLECNVSSAGFYTEVLRRTHTTHTLTSFTLLSNGFTDEFRSSSIVIDFLRQSAPTLAHLTLGTSDIRRSSSSHPVQDARDDYVSPAMRARLSTLTSLRCLSLRFTHRSGAVQTRAAAFSRLILLLASFPRIVRRVEFSLWDDTQRRLDEPRRMSWSSPELELRTLEPMLEEYGELEAVVFHSVDGISPTERQRIMSELPQLVRRNLIRFSKRQICVGL